MLPLFAIQAAGKGLEGIISGIEGISELSKARRMERNNPRPTESIPQGVLDATALAKLMAATGLPGDVYNKAYQDIQRTGTKAISEARDRRSAVDLISTIQQGTNDAILGLNAEQGKAKTQNMQGLIQQLGELGNWQDKIWDWNSRMKFEENAAAIRALRTAGKENINTAINSVLSAGAETASGLNQQQVGGATSVSDPTVTNPDLFGSGVPSTYLDYLNRLQALKKYQSN